MKPLTDTVGLMVFGFRSRMFDLVELKIEIVGILVKAAAELRPVALKKRICRQRTRSDFLVL
jgi:hypothetical protein